MVHENSTRRGAAPGRTSDPRVALLKELADPLRLRVVDRLGQAGPATVSQLAGELDASLPQLSNHLRRLRASGLVRVRRSGRQAVYELADPGLRRLLPLLDRLTGRPAPPAGPPAGGRAASRTCYRHLGGPLGVELYRGLLDRAAIVERADGTVTLGSEAASALAALGVDPAGLRPGRRRLAFQCLDATERVPHLAGALGDAVAAALLDRGWVARVPDGGRAMELTRRGATGLRRALGRPDPQRPDQLGALPN